MGLIVPVDVMIELASSCNLACSYCYHSASNKDKLPFTKGIMPEHIALDILDQSARLEVNSLKFNFRGESTINPSYTKIVKYAKSLASGLTFIDRIANTNFQILPKFRDDKFDGLASLTKVKVSFDSFNKQIFESQRIKGDHDLIMENIDLFYNSKERIKSETQLILQAVRTKANADEDFMAIAKSKWPEIEVSIRDMVDGRLETSVQDEAVNDRDFDNRQSCIQAFVRMIFLHDGRAQMCCPDIKEKLVLGNINETSLYELFNSSKAEMVRSNLRDKKAFLCEPCKGCSSYESFKGFKPNKDS